MLTVLLGAPVALVKAIDRANRRVFFMKPNNRRLIALLAGAASLLISCGNQNNGDVIRIGLECAYVPFNWVAEESEYTLPIANHAGSFADGYDIQIAKKISSELGKKVEIVQTKWESLITDLQMGAIDAIVAGMTDTEERRRQISFTEEYYRSELVLVTAQAVAARYESPLSASEFGSLVNGQNIVSQVSTVTDDVIDVFAEDYGARHVTPVSTFALAAQDVRNGSAFAMTAELPVARSITSQFSDLGVIHIDQEILGEAQAELGVSIGARKADTTLVADVNRVLASINSETRLSYMEAAITRSAGVE
jgi:putative lysine transport system substrate-binding protein/putative lysine transport system permease protein